MVSEFLWARLLGLVWQVLCVGSHKAAIKVSPRAFHVESYLGQNLLTSSLGG